MAVGAWLFVGEIITKNTFEGARHRHFFIPWSGGGG